MAEPEIIVGERIKERREEAHMSLNALAQQAGVSKGYLWSLEKGESHARPSGETLYRIAQVLGTTMSDLLGRKLLTEQPRDIPDSLRAFAEAERLTESDMQMLAAVNFRGRRPEDRESWSLVWGAIKASVRK
jgi:transcriptional regulator with XRE-family HTH domain